MKTWMTKTRMMKTRMLKSRMMKGHAFTVLSQGEAAGDEALQRLPQKARDP